MFRIETTDTAQLKRIVVGGSGALLIGLALLAINVVGPLFDSASYGIGNLVFGLFGVFIVVLAAHPTYQAAQRLNADYTGRRKSR